MARVVIGVDPHKLSATIEVLDEHESVLATGRFGTDKAGYAAMRRHVAGFPGRTWAVEGSSGAGRPLAQRLLADGEHVVDVPAKLSARARALDTGHNRKTDSHDAHAVAVVAVRTKGLRVLAYDTQLEALRLLVDRRAELTRARIQCVNRVHRLLSELVPGQSKKMSTSQAKAILATVKPRDIAGKTRRRLAAEQIAELVAIEKKAKALTKELKELVTATGSRLMDLPGVGPVVAARTLADVGDVARFTDRNRFASWTGTAPIEASSGEVVRHRLSRAGNRRMNHMIHMAATTQLRHDTDGRAYYRHKLPPGRPRPKPCAALNAGSPTPCTASSAPTPRPSRSLTWTRAREGTAGRHLTPARPACTRTPALRISHSRDPHPRPYARPPRHGRARARDRSNQPLDIRGVPKWGTSEARAKADGRDFVDNTESVPPVVPFWSAVGKQDRRRHARQPAQHPVRGSGQGLRAPLRPTPNQRRVTRGVQDALAGRPAGQHPERPRQGQGLPGPPGPGSDREEGGRLMSDTTLDVTRYTYRVTWSVEDEELVATCLEFPSLSWLAGTQEDALAGLRDLVAEVVHDLHESGEPVPEPLSSRSFSGKFNLRVGTQLHRRLAMEAAEEHLSLNQYVVRRLNNAS